MSELIRLALPPEPKAARVPDPGLRAVCTDAVNVVFTQADETLAAVRVASALGTAMAAPVTLVHLRPIPYPLSVDAPAGVSSVETDEFMRHVRDEGISLRVRVFLCRNEDVAIPTAFRRRSLIVIGGRRRRWPTASDRLRRRLEAAGHFVVFVDALEHKEDSRA